MGKINASDILVTNYSEKIYNQPIEKIHPNARLLLDVNTMELSINECLFVGVFEKIPFMRKIKANESWFKNNIYHLK